MAISSNDTSICFFVCYRCRALVSVDSLHHRRFGDGKCAIDTFNEKNKKSAKPLKKYNHSVNLNDRNQLSTTEAIWYQENGLGVSPAQPTRLISRLSMERTETECLRTAMKMFIEASTLESALVAYGQLISLCKANRSDNYEFYKSIRDKFNWWKVKQLWEMLDKRYMNREYLNQQAGKDLRVLVVGAGPCGLRLAIECAFLGAKVFVLEKRESFVRNNLLHLWPYAKEDLKNLGARILYPKFSVGSTTHISVSSLQLILLKVALLVGVEVYENVAFYKLIEPKMNSNGEISGWKAALIPENHVLADYQFNVLIDASGKQNTVTGFSYKEFQERSSIGITANFINNNTKMEGLMNECLYDMSYFNGLNFLRKLKANTGIELENFTYHKGDMHHFTMTAKKQNLLNRGIIVQNDDQDLELLDEKNICHEKLLAYVLDGVNFATNNLAMNLEFALNENNLPDVTMFSFTSFFKAEHSSRFEYKQGRPLLLALVGDSLQKPIWNSGSSIGRGFMSALDAAWMIRSFGCGRPILELLAEKECNYQLLTQVTPCTLQGNVANYTINPCTRYYLTDNLPLPNQMPPLLSSDSHGFLIEEQYSLPSVSYTEDVKFQQLNALFNWLQNTFAFHHRRLNDLMSLFNNGTILGMIICHYIRQKAKEIATVRSLWGIEAPDDPKDYEQVCEYLSKIKQKIEEESSSTPTMVLTMGQTKSEEWMEKSVHNGIQPTDVSKNASVEGLKAKEKSQQKTANENDESQRWRLNSERTTVIKADTALQQTLNNNHMKCKSTTSSAKKKLYPAFLQRMIKALGSQLRQRIFKRKSMKNINEVNIYAGDSTVVNPLAQHGLQTNNDKFQSVDSGSGEIYRTVSKDCSNMGATAKETYDVIDKNGDKVEGDKESEKKTKPALLQGSENSQTSPIVIERRVRKSLDPALLQKMNNLLGPQFRRHATQQNSVENIKRMNILAEDSTVEHPQAQQAMQLNNDQFQSTDSFSRHICRIISTDCSSMGATAKETSNDNNENGDRVDGDQECEDKMESELLQIADNNQTSPIVIERRVRKSLNPALLQKMNNLLGPQFTQHANHQKSVENIKQMNILAEDSTVEHPQAQQAMQLNNDQFQSTDSFSRHICRIISTDCSSMGATAKETSNGNNENGDRVDGDQECEDKMESELLQNADNNQTPPIVIERRARKSLDPALLQKMNNLLGPQFTQHANHQKSVENIKQMNILAEDSTVEHPQAQQAMQLNNDQFPSTDSFSRHTCRIISTDCSSMGATAKETSNDNNENGDRVDGDQECEDKMESELLQNADNNQTPPIVIERRVRKSLNPALLQKMNNLLGPQFTQHANHQKSVENIKQMNILAEDSTVEHPQAQQAMQLNNDQFQSTDSFSRHICRIISTDCSSMGATAKETSNDNNENGDRVDRDQECEDKMESELLQNADNNQTPPIVIERRVRKSLDPALLQKMNNLLGPQFTQHVNQQKSVKNIKEVNIFAGHLMIINSLNAHDFQPRNGQFQSIDSCSEQIYSIKGIDYSNKETTVKEITNVNKENANRVHIYNEREEKMNPALLQVVENGQTLPIVIERRVRRTFDPALLQRMNNQLKPQLRQHVTQQRSVKNIQKMKTASTNSATVNPQTENALQARNAQFQSTDSGSEQICRIISTDCSSTGASVKEISNDIIENGDRVDRGKKSEEKTEPKLIHIVDNNQTLPIILERQERKPLDPALLQGMSNLPGPQLQQPVTQRNSMQNIKDMKTIAVDSAVVNSLTQHGLQLNNDQFQFFDSCSGKLDNTLMQILATWQCLLQK
ncbi:[F-actin]-monooxygenase MICAL2 [Trichinella spiralis]|uniref:[F-actin]-monooxygenase MICAL2 n=1 Tax=Trichinella spiralis TaxID=6334 RepID=A0ABR3K4C5_TRISP